MKTDLWVFGYGSLIWRPGFAYVERHPALLRGLHRSFCLLSYVHRGTPERPGIVAGLDQGGACRGMAFRVRQNDRDEALAYLREREQMNYCYVERYRKIHLDGRPRSQPVIALSFVVDRSHKQYCGKLELAEKARLVMAGQGVSGHAVDYLESLIESLEALGIQDKGLLRLRSRVHMLQSSGVGKLPVSIA